MNKLSGFAFNMGLGIALAIGLVFSAHLVTQTLERLKSSDRTVDVKGYAERKIAADYAVWDVNVVARGKDIASCFAAIENHKKTVAKFFESEQIPADQITLHPIRKDTVMKTDERGFRTEIIEGYVLTQSFQIKSRDVQKISHLATKISTLGEKGLEVDSLQPNFLCDRDKLEKVKVEILSEATKGAKERADQFVLTSGTTLGRLVSARQGVFQITTEHATDVSDSGAYDTSSIDKVVKIVVTLAYLTGG
jgi:hypothetical protein